jgi:integrase
MPPWAIERITALVIQRKADGAKDTDPLLCMYFDERQPYMSEHSLYRAYKFWCSKIGIEAAPHSARATAATWLSSQGWNEAKIAEFLRHGDTQAVKAYVKLAQGLKENAGLKINFA